jgi:hypothetical protein
MLALAELIAVLATTIFTGAAIYVSLVEHPARMGCTTEIAATVWAPSYKRGTVMQASLAIVGAIAGVAAWLLGADAMWVVGALFIFAVVPFTLIVIFPTNNRLLAPGRDLASPETRELLVQWGTLHAVRSALSFVASVIYGWQLVWA